MSFCITHRINKEILENNKQIYTLIRLIASYSAFVWRNRNVTENALKLYSMHIIKSYKT